MVPSPPTRIAALLALVMAWDAHAVTYRIDALGNGDFETLQAALYVMADGDVVELEDGVYTGDENRAILFFGKAVTVRSVSNDPDQCVLDCQLASRGLLFFSNESPATIVRGITIRHASTSEIGAGIWITQASPTIENCVVRGCRALQGGGVAVERRSNPRFIDTVILGNNAEEGAGVFLLDEASPEFTGCLIAGNVALRGGGGGVWCGLTSSPTFTRTTISRNVASRGAGLFIHAYSRPVITDSVLWGNCTGSIQGEDAHVWDTSCLLTISCSLVYLPGIGGHGRSSIAPDVVSADPLFCSASYPCAFEALDADSFDVATNSPCISSNNPCQRDLGARGPGCPSDTPALETSWGDLKDRFR
jgi:hypothetical protein